METGGLRNQEKRLLISNLVGLGIAAAVLLAWTIYLLSVVKFDMAILMKLFQTNPDAIAYTIIPLLVIMVWAAPQALKFWKDIADNKVDEGTAMVIKTKRPWISRDWFVQLDAPGKEKVKIQRKDLYKLVPGSKIKYRIAPHSRLLIGFEIINTK
jgi:hypothetical protein